MPVLEQKRRFKTVKFEIDDSGLLKTVALKSGESEFHTPFEKITGNKSYIVQSNKVGLGLGVLMLLVSIAVFIASFYDSSVEKATSLVWLGISCLAFVTYFNTKERKLYLFTSENTTIDFFNDKPSKEAVAAFIDELIKRRNLYLNSKYGLPTKRLEYASQVDNFNWLLNLRVISKTEYDEKLATLNSFFNTASSTNKIGFSPNI